MGHQMLSRVVWRRHFVALAFGCAIFAGAVLPAPPVHAQGVQATETQSRMVHKVKVTLSKSRTFRIDKPFATAVIAAPEIADVLPMSDHSIYRQG
jgi:pilus assembly protein CpaC